MKIQAMRQILAAEPSVPWALYVDTDSIFIGNESFPANPIEASINDSHSESFLFLPRLDAGWNTDFIFVLNNNRSRAFMDYVWKLAG